jgi:hypothetical protein
VNDLEVRKKLLVAESEVYRQAIKLDLQNLRLHSVHLRRKYATYTALKPAFLVAIPFVTTLFSRSRKAERRPRSWFSRALTGWRLFKTFQPLVSSLLAQYAIGAVLMRKRGSAAGNAEQDTPAAVI